MKKIAIWLDDERNPNMLRWRDLIESVAWNADTVIWCKSFEDFQNEFAKTQKETGLKLVAVFFDNDLGEGKEGKHAFTWMEEEVRLHDLERFVLYAQTANPAAKRELQGGFESLNRFWNSRASTPA